MRNYGRLYGSLDFDDVSISSVEVIEDEVVFVRNLEKFITIFAV